MKAGEHHFIMQYDTNTKQMQHKYKTKVKQIQYRKVSEQPGMKEEERHFLMRSTGTKARPTTTAAATY